MTTASAIDFSSPGARRQSLWRYWRGGLQGSEFTWAVAFVIPYIAVFLAFVVYPAFYGLWMGSNPSLYSEVFSDPIYLNTESPAADLCAALGGAGVADLHLDPLDAERRMGLGE